MTQLATSDSEAPLRCVIVSPPPLRQICWRNDGASGNSISTSASYTQ